MPALPVMGRRAKAGPMLLIQELAGLDAQYLQRQLRDFAEGNRESANMHPIAKALSEKEAAAVAKYYAGLTSAKAPHPRKADDETINAGEAIATRGDWGRGLPACAQCHGPAGQGVGAFFPKLAGQSAEYISKELLAWKEGKRTNDPLNLMTGVATKLTQQQIAAVAAYYSSLSVLIDSKTDAKP